MSLLDISPGMWQSWPTHLHQNEPPHPCFPPKTGSLSDKCIIFYPPWLLLPSTPHHSTRPHWAGRCSHQKPGRCPHSFPFPVFTLHCVLWIFPIPSLSHVSSLWPEPGIPSDHPHLPAPPRGGFAPDCHKPSFLPRGPGVRLDLGEGPTVCLEQRAFTCLLCVQKPPI